MDKKQILIKSRKSGSAVKSLYLAYKQLNPVYSIGYICKKANIPSRGYFHDVLNHKKILAKKHLVALAEVFQLDGLEIQYLSTLADLERCKKASEIPVLKAKLKVARESLKLGFRPMPDAFASELFAFKIVAAFSLFDLKASKTQLVNFFGKDKKQQIEECLHKLEVKQIVKREGQKFQLVQHDVSLFGKDENNAHLRFIKDSLACGIDCVDSWFDHDHLSHFQSMILTTNAKKYTRFLKDLRTYIHTKLVALQIDDGDLLVDFNIQTFPTQAASQTTDKLVSRRR